MAENDIAPVVQKYQILKNVYSINKEVYIFSYFSYSILCPGVYP